MFRDMLKKNKGEIKIHDLNRTILSIFDKINDKKVNILEELIKLRNYFDDEKLKDEYIKTIHQFIPKSPQNSFESFFQSQDLFIKKKSKKSLYYFYYRENGKFKEIPFEFQSIISTHFIHFEENRKHLLIFMNIIRKYYVDRLIEIITKYFFYECNEKSEISIHCSVVSIGSTSLVSNYDITIGGVLFPRDIIDKYNEYFIEFWNNFSARVFDTNLYGSTFFLVSSPGVMKKNNIIYHAYQSFETKIKPIQQIFYLPPKKILNKPTYLFGDQIKNSQFEWLIMKILQHQSNYHIKKKDFKNHLEPVIHFILTKMIHSSKTIKEIINEKFGKVDDKIFHLSLNKSIQSYEDTQEKVKNIQLEYEATFENIKNSLSKKGDLEEYQKIIYDFLSRLIETISLSNFYGSETYFCMGTIYHILGYIQNLGPFHMETEYYQQSALENYIDLFRYYSKMSKNEEYAIIKSSKYIYRLYDALEKIKPSKSISQKKDLFLLIQKKLKGKEYFDNINHSEEKEKINIELKIRELYNIHHKDKLFIHILLQSIWNDIQNHL